MDNWILIVLAVLIVLYVVYLVITKQWQKLRSIAYGLMLGAELVSDLKEHVGALVTACRDQHLLVLQAGNGVLRLLPPLTVTSEDIALMLHRLEAALGSNWSEIGEEE